MVELDLFLSESPSSAFYPSIPLLQYSITPCVFRRLNPSPLGEVKAWSSLSTGRKLDPSIYSLYTIWTAGQPFLPFLPYVASRLHPCRHFKRQARQRTPEWITLPQYVVSGCFEHVAPAKTTAALLLRFQARRPLALLNNIRAYRGFGHQLGTPGIGDIADEIFWPQTNCLPNSFIRKRIC